jgi:transcription antitermination factor NusA-like protein
MRQYVRRGGGGDVVDVVAQSHKEIKEQLASAVVHLKLHRTTALESAARADDERKIMSPEFRVIVGSVCVCVSGRGKNSTALYSGLCCRVRDKCRCGDEIGKYSRRPCFRRASFFSSLSPYFSAVQ